MNMQDNNYQLEFDGNGRIPRLVMNMLQRQLGLVPSIVRKEDKGEDIQSLVDSRENDGVNIHNNGLRGDGDGIKLLNKTLQRVYKAIVNKPEIISSENSWKFSIFLNRPSHGQPEN